MSKTRLLNKPKSKNKPKSPVEWNALMRRAIARAEASRDPRLAGLREALNSGKAEHKLRRMSIISEADLAREFKKT